MPRQIWNEGRVVGYSAYEVYVKHALSVDPNHEPATEKEWLASMMAMGSSMLLKVEPDPADDSECDGLHYRDVQFPEDCRLCAANTIMASLFDGEGYVEGSSPWATKVTSYGSLINNDSDSSPDGILGPTGSVPPTIKTEITNDAIVPQIKEYMKIVDGIIIQPGTWELNKNYPPQKDFKPTLSEYPRFRIAFSERVTTPFFLLLTGFTNRAVVDGTTGFDTAVDTLSPSDGDFLGPWAFPWSAKVIFSVPSSFINYFMNNNYTRELKSGTDAISVKSDAIVDFKQNYDENYQSEYYKNNDNNAQIPAKVIELNTLGDDAAVIASYMHSHDFGTASNPKMTILPPALYGALVQSEGTKYFIPLDTVAPGSLKLYGGSITDTTSTQSPYNKAFTLEEEAKHTTAFMRDEGGTTTEKEKASYVVYELNQFDSIVPVSNDYNISIYGALSLTEPIPPYFAQQQNATDPDNWISCPIVASWRIFGNVSEQFKTDFALSSTQIDAILNTRTGAYNSQVNSSMYDSIPSADKSKYYYVMTGPATNQAGHSAANYWSIVPVRINDGHIDITMKRYYNHEYDRYADDNGYLHNIPELIQPNYTTTVSDNYIYLGGWWGGEGPSNHPTIYDSMPDNVKENSFIMDADRKSPSVSDSTKYKSWVDEYAATTLSTIASNSGIDISRVYSDFRNMTLLELVNKVRLYHLTDGSPVTYTENGIKYHGRKEIVMCIPKSNSIVVTNNTVNFESFTDDCILTATVTPVTENKTTMFPLPDIYQRTDGPLGSVGVSGNNHTISLSVADADGNLFDFNGLSGDMTCDQFRDGKLHWSDLIECLASGKSMDLLGPILRDIIANSPKTLAGLADGDYVIRKSTNSSGTANVTLVKQS